MPTQSKMRHDAHFVDALSESFSGAIGKHLPVSAIETNPGQPRHNVGDLTELKASIESKGILEPILVRPIESGKFQIISGERRFRAAIEAGLTEMPCIEFDVEENEVLEIALIENLHRKDLTPFEEAEGFQSLIERFEYTHNRVAETVGKSRVGITEVLSLLRIPEDLRDECRRADIPKSALLEIARCESREKMEELLMAVHAGATREDLRRSKKADSKTAEGNRRPRPFQFRYAPKDSPFRLSLAFKKSRIAKEEVVEALEKILAELKAGNLELKNR
ncbi:MAG: ParB/RepB/Spo0J family partition protein [Thermoanaerobaculia bacterium]